MRPKNNPAKCNVEECNKAARSRGWCPMHYTRWRSTGDPHAVKAFKHHKSIPLQVRFVSYFDSSEDGCWLWTGALDKHGYGNFKITTGSSQPRYARAHRYSYELFRGAIPDGMALDHVCHNSDADCKGGVECTHRRCVNPAHLEPVTIGQNVLRGKTVSAKNGAKTHCKRGHEFTAENTIVTATTTGGGVGRSCRACVYESNRVRYMRKRQAR